MTQSQTGALDRHLAASPLACLARIKLFSLTFTATFTLFLEI
jgi:hypothetical protein